MPLLPPLLHALERNLLNLWRLLSMFLLRPSDGRTFFLRIVILAFIFALFQSCNGGERQADKGQIAGDNQLLENAQRVESVAVQAANEPTELLTVNAPPAKSERNAIEPAKPIEEVHAAEITDEVTTAVASAVTTEATTEVTTVVTTAATTDKPMVETHTPGTSPPRIAIIIDDIGYRFNEGRELIELPYPLTFAFIPFSPHGARLAELANQLDKPVMLHAPMATLNESKWEDSLNPTMEQAVLIASLDAMLADIPHVTGVNNHGGSLFTQSRKSMQWLSEALAERELFFVDSRTTAESVAKEEAQRVNIPFNERDVFLDNEREPIAIDEQLDKLVEIALKHGHAVAIGHPYPETLAALKMRLPLLAEQGVEVVGIERLLSRLPPTLTHTQADKTLPEG